MFRPRFTSSLIASCLLASISACSTAATSSACQPAADFAHIDVVLATDVTPLSSFPPASAGSQNQYSNELGGATIAITLSADHHSLKRSWTEPGQPPAEQTYAIDCADPHYLLGQGVTAKFVKDGLIVQETHPNTEGIPADMGMFYAIQH
ncbi:hypothetical protein QCD60_14445 [Pokkaliibacter sp. MBI-7]|uniref:hypothetical protein n=1 Tax=Pokkaliibacter sp. MBI-7 TaxID=3040600 RepID=UPI00244C0439|nr:hypothetical protein [Pokkaliibacter sp. MBI-7]MDH2433769.1 hypothetical protein [Pokkaliibacter sp. MBI-7]